jgi:hypothetical protein
VTAQEYPVPKNMNFSISPRNLNVSTEEIRTAIEKVGNSREKVEEYLKGNRGGR